MKRAESTEKMDELVLQQITSKSENSEDKTEKSLSVNGFEQAKRRSVLTILTKES
jgi:hypothetical protein